MKIGSRLKERGFQNSRRSNSGPHLCWRCEEVQVQPVYTTRRDGRREFPPPPFRAFHARRVVEIR
jgi:hypothetical protein